MPSKKYSFLATKYDETFQGCSPHCVSEFTHLNEHCTGATNGSGLITAVHLSSTSHSLALGYSRKCLEDTANIDWRCFLSEFVLLTEGLILLFSLDGAELKES